MPFGGHSPKGGHGADGFSTADDELLKMNNDPKPTDKSEAFKTPSLLDLEDKAKSEAKNVLIPSQLNEAAISAECMRTAIISLISQFASTRVRGDFLNGHFGCSVNPAILPMLDELRCLLIPRWATSGWSGNVSRCNDAAVHFGKLIANSPERLLTDCGETPMTYAQWMSTLHMIAADPYWENTQPDDRCMHISTSETPEVKVARKKSKNPIKIEEVVLSSDGELDTASEESLNDASSESSRHSESRSSDSSAARSKASRRKRRSRRKSVVTPPKFQMDGKTSLEDYLTTFEDYFRKKYSGGSQEKTQVLGEFLSGDIQKVFEIKGGRKLQYNVMKRELLQYYKSQKIGNRSYWKKQLDQIKPETDESYEILGMRLTEVAALAYPKSKSECALKVRQSFLKCLPSTMVTKITDAERVNKAVTGKSKRLPFKSIVKIASDMQKELQVKQSKVMYTSEALNTGTKPRTERQHPPRTYSNQQKWSPNKGVPNRTERLYCEYCRLFDHERPTCWREAKLCLICGGKHKIEQCPKYDPNRARKRQGEVDRKPLN